MSQIFRLKDIFYGIRKHLSVIVGMTLGGLIIGIMLFVLQSYSSSNTVSYQVFASFSVSTSNYAGVFTNGTDSPNLGDFQLADELIPAVAYICRSQKVCEEAIKRTGLLGIQTKSVQNALSLSQQGDTSVVEITLRWGDKEEGELLLQTILEVLPSAVQEVLKVGEIQMIEPPITTDITVTVKKSIIVMLTGVGFLIGLLYCFSQLYLHPTLIEIKDVNELFGINLLSDIPEEPDFPTYLNENLITNRDDLPIGFKESYTALAHITLHQMEEDHFCLFVTSAARGEGKTTVVSNLGLALAALDKRVLLIDFDLSSPALGGCFLDEIDDMHTVNAVYFDEASAREAIIKINENLDILPAKLDKRHMGINRFAKKLVAQMQEEYDIVLLDTEPVGESSEMLYFSSVSDSALFVIRYDYTPCDQIESSVERLQKTNTTIHGAVVNRVARLGLGRTGGKDNDKKDGSVKELFVKIKGEKPKKETENAGAKSKRGGQAYLKVTSQASETLVQEDDDSDLKDDDLLNQILSQMEHGASAVPSKRRDQSMLHDDEFEDEEDPAPIETKPPETKKKTKEKGKNKDKSKKADNMMIKKNEEPISLPDDDWDGEEPMVTCLTSDDLDGDDF